MDCLWATHLTQALAFAVSGFPGVMEIALNIVLWLDGRLVGGVGEWWDDVEASLASPGVAGEFLLLEKLATLCDEGVRAERAELRFLGD